MFDHRLGSLLRRSIGEIHQLPYPEYKSWRLFYSVEPWGWDVEEYRLARLLALLININRSKGTPLVRPEDLMRDINKVIQEQEDKQVMIKEFAEMPRNEKRAFVIRQAKMLFGAKEE